MLRCIAHLSLFLSLAGCGLTANINSTLDAGAKVAQPVVEALEAYRSRHQTYPDSLNELVSEGMLSEIPLLPEVGGTLGVRQLTYSLAPDGSFYELRFAYDFPEALGPGWIISRDYLSDERVWRTAKYPPSFDSLVADRSGRIYREQGSFKALKTVVDRVVKNSTLSFRCINLFKEHVVGRLGDGEPIEIPADLRRAQDTDVVRYSSKERNQPSYVFVFQGKIMTGMNEDGSFADREFQVAAPSLKLNQARTTFRAGKS